MKTVDLSGTIVMYNFVVGLLLMLASEKLAAVAGHVNRSHSKGVIRLTQLSTFTFGAAVAGLSAAIYVLFHLLRLEL
jgi:hypothetical protein